MRREPYRVLVTDPEGNFLYMNLEATEAELTAVFAGINQRSDCSAEVVPELGAGAESDYRRRRSTSPIGAQT